jgi:hypothetical protein
MSTEELMGDNYLKVYSPNEDKIIHTKESFCKELWKIFKQFPK